MGKRLFLFLVLKNFCLFALFESPATTITEFMFESPSNDPNLIESQAFPTLSPSSSPLPDQDSLHLLCDPLITTGADELQLESMAAENMALLAIYALDSAFSLDEVFVDIDFTDYCAEITHIESLAPSDRLQLALRLLMQLAADGALTSSAVQVPNAGK